MRPDLSEAVVISFLDLSAILLGGRSPTNPLPNASILEKEKDRDYLGSLNPDKMQPPLPCIRCCQQEFPFGTPLDLMNYSADRSAINGNDRINVVRRTGSNP